jgi:hypothetical protein
VVISDVSCTGGKFRGYVSAQALQPSDVLNGVNVKKFSAHMGARVWHNSRLDIGVSAKQTTVPGSYVEAQLAFPDEDLVIVMAPVPTALTLTSSTQSASPSVISTVTFTGTLASLSSVPGGTSNWHSVHVANMLYGGASADNTWHDTFKNTTLVAGVNALITPTSNSVVLEFSSTVVEAYRDTDCTTVVSKGAIVTMLRSATWSGTGGGDAARALILEKFIGLYTVTYNAGNLNQNSVTLQPQPIDKVYTMVAPGYVCEPFPERFASPFDLSVKPAAIDTSGTLFLPSIGPINMIYSTTVDVTAMVEVIDEGEISIDDVSGNKDHQICADVTVSLPVTCTFSTSASLFVPVARTIARGTAKMCFNMDAPSYCGETNLIMQCGSKMDTRATDICWNETEAVLTSVGLVDSSRSELAVQYLTGQGFGKSLAGFFGGIGDSLTAHADDIAEKGLLAVVWYYLWFATYMSFIGPIVLVIDLVKMEPFLTLLVDGLFSVVAMVFTVPYTFRVAMYLASYVTPMFAGTSYMKEYSSMEEGGGNGKSTSYRSRSKSRSA